MRLPRSPGAKEVVTVFNKVTLEHAILNVGDSPISSVLTWDSEMSEESLRLLVAESDNLSLVGEEIVFTRRNQGQVVTPPSFREEGVTLESVLSMINAYNAKVEREFKETFVDSFTAKREALEMYLKETYDAQETEVFGVEHAYSLRDEGIDAGYAVIIETLSKDVGDLLEAFFRKRPADVYVVGERLHEVGFINHRLRVVPSEETAKAIAEIAAKTPAKNRLEKIPQEIYLIVREEDVS